ncbi:hypothetical protein BGX24_011653 [Mortierella sp. AD032]|nr:hypothetical protein BGX24_011653 [Mortierella sp. AD032]
MSQQSSRHYIHVNPTPIITGTPHVTYSSNVSPTQRSPSQWWSSSSSRRPPTNADADAGTGADANAEAGEPD